MKKHCILQETRDSSHITTFLDITDAFMYQRFVKAITEFYDAEKVDLHLGDFNRCIQEIIGNEGFSEMSVNIHRWGEEPFNVSVEFIETWLY